MVYAFHSNGIRQYTPNGIHPLKCYILDSVRYASVYTQRYTPSKWYFLYGSVRYTPKYINKTYFIFINIGCIPYTYYISHLETSVYRPRYTDRIPYTTFICHTENTIPFTVYKPYTTIDIVYHCLFVHTSG